MSISSLTIAVYIVMCAYSIDYNGGIEPMATNPMVGPSAITLSELGANNGLATPVAAALTPLSFLLFRCQLLPSEQRTCLSTSNAPVVWHLQLPRSSTGASIGVL